MDYNKLAHELHRRRLSISSNAARHQAAGEARFFEEYGYEPDLDDYDSYLNVYILNDGAVLTVITGDSDSWQVPSPRAMQADYVFFTQGTKLAETEVVGWLPSERIIAAPIIAGRHPIYMVDRRCVYPPPMDINFDDGGFGFHEPELDVPGVWDYDLGALWTPLGFHVYDADMSRLVLTADSEMK